jgi:hypothetical protein
LRSILIKKFNIYNLIYSFLKKLNIEIIVYKSYIKKFYINVYLFIYIYEKRYFKIFKSLNFLSFKEKLILSKKKIFDKPIRIKKKKKIFLKYKPLNIILKTSKVNTLKSVFYERREELKYLKRKKIKKFNIQYSKSLKFNKKNFNIKSLKKFYIQYCKSLKLKNKFYKVNKKNFNIKSLKKFNIFKIKSKFIKFKLQTVAYYKKFKLIKILNVDFKSVSFFNYNFLYPSNNNKFRIDNVFFLFFYKNYIFIILYIISLIALLKKKLFRYKYTLKLLFNNLVTAVYNYAHKNLIFNNYFIFNKITLKLKKLQLEKILLKMSGKGVNIYFRNVLKTLNVRGLLKIPTNCRIWWLKFTPFFKDFINILYFSMNFRTSKLLALFISKNITNKKKHYNFLKKIKKIMNYFFKYDRANNFYGIYITVHGKFQGILRKRKFKIKFGRAGTQKFKVSIDYNLQKSFTRFGVFSIKVWLAYFD